MTKADSPGRTNKYEEFICKICGKLKLRCKVSSRGRKLPSGVRSKGSVTCSKKCSSLNAHPSYR